MIHRLKTAVTESTSSTASALGEPDATVEEQKNKLRRIVGKKPVSTALASSMDSGSTLG